MIALMMAWAGRGQGCCGWRVLCSQLLVLGLLFGAVQHTAGRSKGQQIVSSQADAPEKRTCKDIIGASAADCPRSVVQSMTVAELQRTCDLKMIGLSTDTVLKQVRLQRSGSLFPPVGRRGWAVLPRLDRLALSLSHWRLGATHSWLMTRAGPATGRCTTLTNAREAVVPNARHQRALKLRACGGCRSIHRRQRNMPAMPERCVNIFLGMNRTSGSQTVEQPARSWRLQ